MEPFSHNANLAFFSFKYYVSISKSEDARTKKRGAEYQHFKTEVAANRPKPLRVLGCQWRIKAELAKAGPTSS